MASRSPSGPDRGRRSRTSSSAARSGRSAARSQQKAAGSGPQITTRAVILLSVVVLLFASYTASLRAWWSARQEIEVTKAERATLRNEIKELKSEQARFDDPAFIKQQARERFGWVMPGEVGYRVIGADGTVRGDVPELTEPPKQRSKQWYDRVWASVETAGTPETEMPTKPDADKPLVDREDESQ